MLSETAGPDLSGKSRTAGKIAITIEKPEKLSHISEVFGRCSYFLIYDQEKNSKEFLPNPFSTEIGGAGIHSAKFLIENNVDIVIVKNIGINPFRLLTSVNIKIYKSNGDNAEDELQFFSKGILLPIEKINNDFPSGRKRNRCGRLL